jgi:transcription-repair coupling factor (superfamily II helicase)
VAARNGSRFPYEETPGQLQAINDTKADLESDKPMDRLVCGDVGYGKTEVAVRAAFKVVQEGKQVAVLVPTTILAQQHGQTFSERLAAYPTRIEVLSRFRTPGEQKKVVEDVRLGAVDILVGTHRLVQKDVEFHNLGLVIVDEEQRFGVLQKERLKELRKEVDILTLSATPIPRTMHFALGGLREMSLITDPPAGACRCAPSLCRTVTKLCARLSSVSWSVKARYITFTIASVRFITSRNTFAS